jgi:hypothetical protein
MFERVLHGLHQKLLRKLHSSFPRIVNVRLLEQFQLIRELRDGRRDSAAMAFKQKTPAGASGRALQVTGLYLFGDQNVPVTSRMIVTIGTPKNQATIALIAASFDQLAKM